MLYSTDETAGAISKRLILYMGASNRSVSTLETLQLGVAVLINLTRYTPTAHFVYSVSKLFNFFLINHELIGDLLLFYFRLILLTLLSR